MKEAVAIAYYNVNVYSNGRPLIARNERLVMAIDAH